MLLPGLVAVGTLGVRMAADERPIREVVIERRFVEFNNGKVPAFVIGMAVRASSGSRVFEQAVKACALIDVCPDVFVTFHTQGPLPTACKRFVA
jgi:hypothetical protein